MNFCLSLFTTYLLGLCFALWGDLVLRLLVPRILRDERRLPFPIHALFSCGVGGIVVSLLTLALGLLHLLYGITVAASLLLGPLVSVLTGRWRYLMTSTGDTIEGIRCVFWRQASREQRPVVAIALGIVLVFSVVIHILAAAPLYDPDGLTYHMALPRLYAAQHAITPLYGINELGNKPFAIDMWRVDAVVLGVPSVGTMLSALCLLWLIGTCVVIAFYLFRIQSPALLAIMSLVIIAQPMMPVLATWSYVEVPVAWYESLLVLALLLWLDSATLAYATLMGLCGGMIMSSKESGMAALAGIFLIVAITGIARRSIQSIMVPSMLALMVGAAVIASPWYIRSVLWTGDITGLNFPLLSVLKETVTHNTSLSVTASAGTTGSIVNPSLWQRVALGWLPMSYAPQPAGIPFFPANLLLLLCPLPLLLRRNWMAICLTVLAVLHIYLWQRIPIGYRQFFIYTPLLLLLAVWGWSLLHRRLRLLPAIPLVILLTFSFVSIGWSTPYDTRTLLLDATRSAFQPDQADSFLQRYVPGYDVEAKINAMFANKPHVRFLVAGFSYFYYLSVPYVSIKATSLLQPPPTLTDTAEVRDYLKKRHICGLITLERDFTHDFRIGFDVPYYPPTAYALAAVFHGSGFRQISDGQVLAIVPVDNGHPSTTCVGHLSADSTSTTS